MIGQIYQVLFSEFWLKVSGKNARVLGSNTQRHYGAGVAEDRVSDGWFELVEMLVGQDKRDFELSQFGDHVCDRERCEALELIDENVMRLS